MRFSGTRFCFAVVAHAHNLFVSCCVQFSNFPCFTARGQPKGTDDYLPAGVMAVPRSQQVSEAIFEQEENLKKASCFRVQAHSQPQKQQQQ